MTENPNIEALYAEHKGIIYSRAMSFHHSTGHDLDDLIGQGHFWGRCW